MRGSLLCGSHQSWDKGWGGGQGLRVASEMSAIGSRRDRSAAEAAEGCFSKCPVFLSSPTPSLAPDVQQSLRKVVEWASVGRESPPPRSPQYLPVKVRHLGTGPGSKANGKQ